MGFTSKTPSENFIGHAFTQKFDGNQTKWKVRVLSFTKGENVTLDAFTLYYPKSKETMVMQKAELVEFLVDHSDPRLLADERWILRVSLMDFRFINFSCMMLDVYDVMAKLSCSQQSNSVTLFDMIENIGRATNRLSVLEKAAGKNEQEFVDACELSSRADIYRGVTVAAGQAGRVKARSDRQVVLVAIKEHLVSRFTEVVPPPHRTRNKPGTFFVWLPTPSNSRTTLTSLIPR